MVVHGLKNEDMVKKYGISLSSVHRIRRKLDIPANRPGHPRIKLVKSGST
jgi:hypothetical protein